MSNKFQRGNFKGERTIQNLNPELKRLLDSYVPSTMMATEIDDFRTTLSLIAKDYDEIDDVYFKEVYEELNKMFSERDPNYVAPDF